MGQRIGGANGRMCKWPIGKWQINGLQMEVRKMNVKVSREWLVSLSVTLGMLTLVWAIGSALAQGPEPRGDTSTAATVNSRISYQGVLTEGGTPVNGSRKMVFDFYDNDTCSGVAVLQVIKDNVPVTDGLFSVELDVTHGAFWGQGLWLEVEVDGTSVGCKEILPVPYALSLRPGATVSSNGIPLILSSSDNDGLRVESADDDGVHVGWAGDDGVSVDSAGGDGV